MTSQCVYAILNQRGLPKYIGRTNSPERRMKEHVANARRAASGGRLPKVGGNAWRPGFYRWLQRYIDPAYYNTPEVYLDASRWPRMVVLELAASLDEAKRLERWWMCWAVRHGFDIANRRGVITSGFAAFMYRSAPCAECGMMCRGTLRSGCRR